MSLSHLLLHCSPPSMPYIFPKPLHHPIFMMHSNHKALSTTTTVPPISLSHLLVRFLFLAQAWLTEYLPCTCPLTPAHACTLYSLHAFTSSTPVPLASHSIDLFALSAQGAIRRPNPAVFSMHAAPGENRKYGGESTFKPLADARFLERNAHRISESDAIQHELTMETRLMRKLMENRWRDIDAARDYKLSLDAPVLSEFVLDVVEGRYD